MKKTQHVEKGSGCLEVGGGMLGGLQGLGHSGAGVRWQRQRWHPRMLHTSGRTHSTALPPWKRLGSANPWQHPPPHGNPPLMATHAPPSAPALHRAHHGGPPHHGTPCVGPRRDAPRALVGTKSPGWQNTALEHHGVHSWAGVSTHQKLLLEPAQRRGLAGFCYSRMWCLWWDGWGAHPDCFALGRT